MTPGQADERHPLAAMKGRLEYIAVEEAAGDLQARTLATIQGIFARFVYLASLRDYTNGQYYHAGLADQFGEDVASQAIEKSHREHFRRICASSVKETLHSLEEYLIASGTKRNELGRLWSDIEPYRVTVPAGSDSISKKLFQSNISVALLILETGETPSPDGQRVS